MTIRVKEGYTPGEYVDQLVGYLGEASGQMPQHEIVSQWHREAIGVLGPQCTQAFIVAAYAAVRMPPPALVFS